MSRLETNSVVFRNEQLTKNIFKTGKEYDESSSNALSDGDEHGKGEKDGSVGGLTDIKTRNTLLTKNKYNSSNEYNESNA